MIQKIPEIDIVPHMRLGRHVNHDERNRDYPVRAAVRKALRSVRYKRHVSIYDQGNLGSCTANAICGTVCTGRFPHHIRSQRTVRRVYHQETMVDPFDGVWPPDDTGSDGTSACKVAQKLGWVGRYEHAFNFDAVITALQLGPVIAGFDWMSSFDRPTSSGECPLTSDAWLRGGHEVSLVGVDLDKRQILFANSWGTGWGDQGYAWFSFDTFETLMNRKGDVTVPYLP